MKPYNLLCCFHSFIYFYNDPERSCMFCFVFGKWPSSQLLWWPPPRWSQGYCGTGVLSRLLSLLFRTRETCFTKSSVTAGQRLRLHRLQNDDGNVTPAGQWWSVKISYTGPADTSYQDLPKDFHYFTSDCCIQGLMWHYWVATVELFLVFWSWIHGCTCSRVDIFKEELLLGMSIYYYSYWYCLQTWYFNVTLMCLFDVI